MYVCVYVCMYACMDASVAVKLTSVTMMIRKDDVADILEAEHPWRGCSKKSATSSNVFSFAHASAIQNPLNEDLVR